MRPSSSLLRLLLFMTDAPFDLQLSDFHSATVKDFANRDFMKHGITQTRYAHTKSKNDEQ